MSMQAIVCDSSVIRGMSNDPSNICYHYRHHLTGKQVYHCEVSYREVVNGLIRDLQITIDTAEVFFANWKAEFTSRSLSQTKQGERSVVMLEMSPDGEPRPKKLTLPHRQKLEERLDMAGIDLNASVVATD